MALKKKGNKAYSIMTFKCPKCMKGDLYPTGTFSFSKPFEMNDTCVHCGQKFFPEPGFYYGAMFISYIFTGWFSIGFVLLLHWILKWSTTASFAALIGILGLFFVYIFRLSRSIWLGLMVKYDPPAEI
jgi:uncharacterized protein (DUF983 family)